MFLGSDALALAPLTRRIAYLEEGDWVVLTDEGARFFDAKDAPAERKVVQTAVSGAAVGKGNYRHFMEKELHEHPAVLGDTLRQYLDPRTLEVRLPRLPFDPARIPRLTLSACGSAFLAAHVGRYWIEQLARLPCDVEIASEFRYRDPVLEEGGLSMFVSQSGETIDTLSALRFARGRAEGEVVAVTYVALLTLSLGGARYCARIGRQHRANNVYWVVDVGGGRCWQGCLDPDCRGFKGPLLSLPLEVLPEHRRRGIGRALLAAATAHASAKGCTEAVAEVLSPSQTAACALLTQAGFAQAGSVGGFEGGQVLLRLTRSL
jgi:L-amino acid N-acyltransferase YncA